MARKAVKQLVAPAEKYPPAYEFRFRAGSYRPPQVNVGDTLHDLRSGCHVQVSGFTKAPIPWPAYNYNTGRHDGLLPILCGDLVRAVCEEEELVVAHYWGVTRHMANEWKKAVAGATDSNQVAMNLAMKRLDPAFRKKFGY